MITLKFRAILDELPQMMEFVRSEINKIKFTSSDAKKCEIAIEEALVNIIRYAYPEGAGDVEISIARSGCKEIFFTIKDQGIAVNPLDHLKEYDTEAEIEKRPIGGLGLFFMDKILDKIEYQRERESNILNLRKSSK
ncbi:MAG: ATP-binding protein [Simkaniaceae bacterium]